MTDATKSGGAGRKTQAKAKQKAEDVLDSVRDASEEARDQIHNKTKQAKAQARHASQQAGEQSKYLLDRVTDYVHENPLPAMGIAFAAGSLLMALTRHRHEQ